jgi:hypothetical protein
MAKRKMLFHPDYVREKIRASQLINRLHMCALGEISLTITQLRAIEIRCGTARMGARASGREEIEQHCQSAHTANCLESSAWSPAWSHAKRF